jgi:hypothetical protein
MVAYMTNGDEGMLEVAWKKVRFVCRGWQARQRKDRCVGGLDNYPIRKSDG